MTQTPAQPKPKRTRAAVRKRGPLLTIWIVVVAVFGVLTAIQGVLAQSALGLATSAFVFVCAWGLWGWQRWAYFALLFAIIVVLGVLLLALLTSTANMLPFIIALAAGAITIAIIQPRLSDFR
jgi:hypothetical protein